MGRYIAKYEYRYFGSFLENLTQHFLLLIRRVEFKSAVRQVDLKVCVADRPNIEKNFKVVRDYFTVKSMASNQVQYQLKHF